MRIRPSSSRSSGLVDGPLPGGDSPCRGETPQQRARHRPALSPPPSLRCCSLSGRSLSWSCASSVTPTRPSPSASTPTRWAVVPATGSGCANSPTATGGRRGSSRPRTRSPHPWCRSRMNAPPTRAETWSGEEFALTGATWAARRTVCPDANYNQKERLLNRQSAQSDSQADVIELRLDRRECHKVPIASEVTTEPLVKNRGFCRENLWS
jgi:hypothetical protein